MIAPFRRFATFESFSFCHLIAATATHLHRLFIVVWLPILSKHRSSWVAVVSFATPAKFVNARQKCIRFLIESGFSLQFLRNLFEYSKRDRLVEVEFLRMKLVKNPTDERTVSTTEGVCLTHPNSLWHVPLQSSVRLLSDKTQR
jgi:hypothetical protein